MNALARLAVTAGEPAGIGPELVVRLAASELAADLVAITDANLLEATARRCGIELAIESFHPDVPRSGRRAGSLRVLHVPLGVPAEPGVLDPRNAAFVLASLGRAAHGAARGEFDAIVTAPVHKGVINDAGVPFTGHTEFFAERAACEVVMLLATERTGAPPLRVALATTHLPLAAVPQAITRDSLERHLRILERGLRERFGIARPRIAVLGLNPHAGEGGHLGREEIEVIDPVVQALRAGGMALDGPLPADSAFVHHRLLDFDAILAMYHDQGLPVLKHVGFGHAVNVTLGLPWVRTSVDHGTALDIAGHNLADPGSILAAARLAIELAARARQS